MPLDVVMILVPNASHFEITKYCLERGIHVLIEKPFSVILYLKNQFFTFINYICQLNILKLNTIL